jgi:hypothetical protein
MKTLQVACASNLVERALLAYGTNVHDAVLLSPEAQEAIYAELFRGLPTLAIAAEGALDLKWTLKP